MESQLSFGAREYASKKKITKRERFLAEMEEVVPWQALVGLIEPTGVRLTEGLVVGSISKEVI